MSNCKQPEIKYPAEWSYTIIGNNSELMRKAVESIIQPETYSIEESHRSSNAKYTSLKISLVVFSQQERHKYFNQLGSHEDIKIVL